MAENENKKNQYNSDIQSNNVQIQKMEELYESLKLFKHKVEEAKEQFISIKSSRKIMLDDLISDAPNCDVVKKYSNGAKKSLNEVGMTYVKGTFFSLVTVINAKLLEYKMVIAIKEAENVRLANLIKELDDDINDEESEG